MYSRWFNLSVVLLWLVTTGWLVWKKFLPPLLVGDPPDYNQILDARHQEGQVCWDMFCNGKRIGWAHSTTVHLEDGFSEVRSTVHIRNLPLLDMAPALLRAILESQEVPVRRLRFDAETTLSIDPIGHLIEFNSKVELPPLETSIAMRGLVEGGKLKLSIRSGALPPFETERRIPASFRLGDGLSPQTQLPGLREGQTWTEEAYNRFQLFQPQGSAVDVYTATVEGRDLLVWDDRPVDTWLVVYRNESGLAVRSGDAAPAKLWVRDDGTVLKQQVTLFNAEMTFVRLPEYLAAVRIRAMRRSAYGQLGPSLGLPPRYRTLALAQRGEAPGCWDVQWDGRRVGWAVSEAEALPDGGTVLKARTHLDESPVTRLIPGAARALMRIWDARPAVLQMDVRSRQYLDLRDLLERFESSVQVGRFEDVLTLEGSIVGQGVEWSMRQGLLPGKGRRQIASEALVADLTVPQDRLPGVEAGQTWSVAGYCLLRAGDRVMEVLEANVGPMEPILWNGSPLNCYPVVYRSQPNQSVDTAPAMFWVDPFGNVLRQEVRLAGGTLVFTRLPDREAAARLKQVGADTEEPESTQEPTEVNHDPDS